MLIHKEKYTFSTCYSPGYTHTINTLIISRNLNIISIFAGMKTCFYILIFFGLSFLSEIHAQQVSPVTSGKGYRVPVCVYEGDTIPCITLKNIYVYPKLKFKNKRQERYYYKLVRDVKKHFLWPKKSSGQSSRHTNTWKRSPTRKPRSNT